MLRRNEVINLANTIDRALSGQHSEACKNILPRLHDLAMRYVDCMNAANNNVGDIASDSDIIGKEAYATQLTEEIAILVMRLAELGYVMDTMNPKDFCEAFLAAIRLDNKLPNCA